MVVRLPIVTTSTGQEGLPLPLVVRTIPLDLPADASLLDFLPPHHPVTWLRRGDGLVGWGRAAEIQTAGATRFADAAKWWSETTAHAVVRDEVDEPGTGLVCFGTFAFGDDPGGSMLVVPEVIVGRRQPQEQGLDLEWAGIDRPFTADDRHLVDRGLGLEEVLT